ncbi:Guanine nucleotide exchange factor LTE1 [Talaromyces islandicus]|uniref:Guanine nucleotide exchange factor LTE1 n=1 Tax=Talaromyces islandicus TaxID=28573 RepID=A0A0U1MCA9_TALIS|nr:Guanine nucleotide exchange factor LTE1 [Talaromyces islandicus]
MATFLHKSTDVHRPSSRDDSTSPYFPPSKASVLGDWTPLRRVQPSQPSLRRANTVTQSGITKRPDRLLANRRKKDQSPTLGHTKSSTEALHQRAMTHDGIAGPREGNHFTVANVGNNGKLYLRPRIDSRHHGQPINFSPPSQTRSKPTPITPAFASDTRQSIWSSSQFSELRPKYARGEADQSRSDADDHEPRERRRAHSFSTISEYEPPAPAKNGQELRIVIDRFDSNDSIDAPAAPSPTALEVPIPHYRLGTPQFNPQGSPVLRSSFYTETSMSDNTPLPSYLKGNEERNRIPSTYDSPALSPPAATLSVAMSLFSGVSPAHRKSRYSNSTRRSGIYNLRHPIEPAVFDFLTEDMNDPSVVKYIADGRDISAATPARIVAEISSDSFMDYELVSDFFLTFRPYLSSTNLLALLLARLEWAINRLQDDGRIIRIRTFAALRHWILNYFADDFLNNRDLRVQFCDKINSMYTDVTARATAGISDIKILVDLKRCWHGRCLLYWDCEAFVFPDNPVIPGGVSGSRDLTKTRLSKASAPYPEAVIDPDMDSALPESAATRARETTSENNSPQKAHVRNASSGTSHSVPGSSSGYSIQALSCSFPPRRVSASLDSVNSPHPVVVPTQSTTSPSNPRSPAASSTRRTPVHGHKRSGSFSDSIRDDRAPLSQPVESQNQTILSTSGNSSLIRGNLLPPGEAIIRMQAPPSPTIPQTPDELSESHTRSASDGNIKPLGASPGLRTVIGSIRRALHSRPLGTSNAVANGSVNVRFPRGKTAALPVNLAFKSDFYKDRRALPVSKYYPKVDYFCQQSTKEYREALGLDAPKPSVPFSIEPYRSDVSVPQLQVPNPQLQRLGSEVTMGSKSILIVDDTGLNMPVASGGLGWPAEQDENDRSRESSLTRYNESSSQLSQVPVPTSTEDLPNIGYFTTQPLDSPVQRFLGTPSVRKTDSIASRLRKYASFHSGASPSTRDGSSDTASSEAGGEKPLARMLRRRPGGNLRKIQNVHDLEPHLRPQSFATDTSLTESVASSARHYIRRTFARSSQIRALSTPPRFDLVNTHSSQNLRPSFEAAIAEFSRIPDDTDGGIESTLLKLEGKWPLAGSSGSRADKKFVQHSMKHEGVGERDAAHVAFREVENDSEAYQTTPRKTVVTEGRQILTSQVYTDSVVSEFSDSSIPLLERGLSDDSMKKPHPTSHQFDAPRPLSIKKANQEIIKRGSSPRSFQIIDDTESLRQLSKTQGFSQQPSTDEPTRGYHSDLSSEVSVDIIDRDEALHNSNSTGYSLPSASLDVLSHPLAHPPSPPITIPQTTSIPPYPKPETPVVSQTPLTPGPSPTRKVEPTPKAPASSEKNNVHPSVTVPRIQVPQATNHIPFVLAYNSQVLAQQFTVVEKSALDEVDWKDLVEMKWNHNSSTSVSWVQFLAEQERKGIDLVVGRFNLMVKWILSEVVLTRDIQDRARTISKFIHIAGHARRICNYSTMLQIAIALSSVDCTRLQSTWALVSQEDKKLIGDIEALIQPVRNFHELRVEMETANLQNGCIPFVGLYVHDLTYNAQKPSQVTGTPDGDALINFERYRTAARIVKCLLRLIDASDKYSLKPVPGLVEKCLWVSSLSEEQIQALSKNIE